MYAKRIRLIILFAFALLLLTACNFPGFTSQATTNPDVIYTAAAQTLSAQQTEAALGTPIVLPSSTSAVGTPTAPVIILPSNTPLPPTNTAVPTNTPVPPTPTNTPIPCDRGQFVTDVTTPDNTEIAVGATFIKTWRLKNNGSCTWTSAYDLVFYSGDAMSGLPESQITNGTVPPGGTVDVSMTMKAPTTPGTYKGNWRLRNAGGVIFGIGPNADQSFWVQIKAVSPTPTPSPTSSYTLSFDFIAKGPDAKWRNASTQIPWGDPKDDTPGVAVNVVNVKMEDGNTYPSLLATYPQLINNGMVLGLYPPYTIQANDHLRTRVGMRYDCTGSVNITFQIRYIEGQSDVKVGEWVEKCDGAISAPIDVNLSLLVGHTVQFELVAIANGQATAGRSLWIAPRIER